MNLTRGKGQERKPSGVHRPAFASWLERLRLGTARMGSRPTNELSEMILEWDDEVSATR